MDDRFTVDGGGDGLANLPMLQNRMSQIDSYVLKRGARIRFNGGICVFLEPRKHVRLDVVLQKVDGSLFKFEHANHGIRNNFDNESRNLRPAFPIVGIGRQDDFFSRVDGFENKGSRAGGRGRFESGSLSEPAGTMPSVSCSRNGAWGENNRKRTREELSCSTAWSCLRSPRLGDWFFGSRIDS